MNKYSKKATKHSSSKTKKQQGSGVFSINEKKIYKY